MNFLINSEHEYEPIAAPLSHPVTAPVVQIIDTDVVPVADSDDSIDERGLLPPRMILGGDVILPLDGRIEDVAMEGQELGETVGDTSEEQDSPQQLQDRLEERYLSSPSPSAPTPTIAPTTPSAESRTDAEVNTSQVAIFTFSSIYYLPNDLFFLFRPSCKSDYI